MTISKDKSSGMSENRISALNLKTKQQRQL